jgi:ABC-type Fe3+ transport system substrate-binding protein
MKLHSILGAAVCLLIVAGPIGSSAQTRPPQPMNMSELVAAVAKEGGVLNIAWTDVYGAGEGAKRVQEALNKKYQLHMQINHSPLSISGAAFEMQVTQEVSAGQQASSDILFDVHLQPEAQNMEAVDWRKYVPGLPADVMYFGGRSVAVVTILNGFMYNTKLVPPEKVPRSLYDLLKPEWKGKIATMPYAGDYANYLGLPGGLGGDATIKYFSAFAKQLGGVIRCGSDDRITSGEFLIFGPDCGDYAMRRDQRRGLPVAEVYPKEGAGLYYFAPGIPKTSAHPMAARLFIAYLLSPEGQNLMWELMGTDNWKLSGSHMAQVMKEARAKGVKFIDAYAQNIKHPELDDYEKQIDQLVNQSK